MEKIYNARRARDRRQVRREESEIFREFLTETRKRHGLTQSDLADLLGKNQGDISKWELGNALPDNLARSAIRAKIERLESEAKK